MPEALSVDDAIEEFLHATEEGSARDRHGRRFTSDATAELAWNLRGHVRETLGALSLEEVRRDDVETLVYDLGDSGLSDERLRAIVRSTRALYDYASERDHVRHNPAERVAVPDEQTAQPTRYADRAESRPRSSGATRAMAIGLDAATVMFVLIAIVLIAQSL
jgi:site-specific recombinase XerC